MATQKRRLGEILVTSGEITQSQLDQALAEQKTNGKRLGIGWSERSIFTSF